MILHRFLRFSVYWVWSIFFTLYTVTAAPSIVTLFDDTLEFQLIAPTLGIAHPTGYPLYLLVGALWSRLLFPFGNWAWRMNLFSSLIAATAVCGLFLVAKRLITTRKGAPNLWAAWAAAITFGLGPIWWGQATIAEVYPLHNLFVIAILNLALGIDQTLPPSVSPPLPHPVTPAPCHRLISSSCHPVTRLSLLFGLALTHHRTTLLLAPGIAIYLLWSVPDLWRPNRCWRRWAFALVMPLLLYLYLPIRAWMGASDLHGSYVNSWAGFWRHILATGYTGFFAGDNPLATPRTAYDWLQIFREQFGWFALSLGIGGCIWLFQRNWRLARVWVALFIIFVTNLIFALSYQVHDAELFLLPAFLCLALFVGAGVGLVERLFSSWPRLAWGLQALTLFLIGLGVGGRGAPINRSEAWATHDYAVALAKVDFPPQSRVVALEGEATALKYMQQAEGLGLAAIPLVADAPEDRQQAIATLLHNGYPTFITREVAGIEQSYSFSGEGPLVRVWPRGGAQAGPPQHPIEITLANGTLRIIGYDQAWLNEARGQTLRVVFYWQTLAPIAESLKVSLRLQTNHGDPVEWEDGTPVQEDHFPLRQVAPTSSWVIGEVMRDVHYLAAPPHLTALQTNLYVIVYTASSVQEVGSFTLPVGH